MGSDRETDGIPAKVRGALVTCLWLAKMDVLSSCSHSLFKPKWRKHLSPHSCYQWTHHAGRGWCYWHHCDGKVASTWNHWSCWAGRILSGVLHRRKWVRFWFIWLTNYMIVRPYNLLHFFFLSQAFLLQIVQKQMSYMHTYTKGINCNQMLLVLWFWQNQRFRIRLTAKQHKNTECSIQYSVLSHFIRYNYSCTRISNQPIT